MSLAGIYDPATVRVAGNVAAATQGATVPDEVLGSGGPAPGSPRFALKRPPLAYTPAPTPTGGASTLTVRVNGAAWTEVDSLLLQPPDARVYQVLTGLNGAATVAFGDGVNGARPPSGHENIHAAYRTGAGASGNVEVGQVSVLRSRPAGVRTVTNPLPGSGGIDPEGAAAARTAGPVRLRVLGRVVSARDYADFALAFPGISRARADALRGAGAPLVVTVAAAGGAAPDPGVLRELTASIDANRLNTVPFRVLPPDPLWFQLRARLAVDPAHERGAVVSAVLSALREAYAGDRRGFAQPVLLAEIITLVQRIAGVVALEPDALFVTGTTARVHQRLDAAPARRDPDTGMPRGAQLLLPHPTLGFTLVPEAP
jgi:predicted phage baseplate assembly protein